MSAQTTNATSWGEPQAAFGASRRPPEVSRSRAFGPQPGLS
jgi:hypothetical protein